jgi:hypothetical protein
MGISLNGLTPAGTYPGLIKTGDNTAISGTPKVLSDGNGNNLPMEVSTTGVNFTNNLTQGGVAVPTASQVAAKQDTLVSGTNIKTINGTNVLGSGNITTPNVSGVAGAIQFSNGSAFASDAANLFWDDTNKRLGVGTNAPTTVFQVKTTQANTNGSIGFFYNQAATIAALTDTGSALTQLQFRASSYNFTDTAGMRIAGGTYGVAPTAMLQVVGSGSTSATTSLLVQNSGGTELLKVSDNGDIATYDITARSIYSRASTLDLRGNASGSASSVSLQGFVSGLGWLSMFTAESGKDFGQIPRGAVVNGTTIDASAIFQVNSTTKGFLPPRMTTTQKNAISAIAGLVVYDSTTNKLCCYNGSTWNDLF